MAAAHASYEDQKKLVFRGLILLGVLTLIEVAFALIARGHVTPSIKYTEGSLMHYFYMFVMVAFSLYKAYFIVFKFMHMGSEVKGLAMSVLMPMLLLVWAVIAFFSEGGYWGESRKGIQEKNLEKVKTVLPPAPTGYIIKSSDIYKG